MDSGAPRSILVLICTFFCMTEVCEGSYMCYLCRFHLEQKRKNYKYFNGSCYWGHCV